MQGQLGDRVKSVFVENVAEGADAERVIRDLAQQGHQLIFTVSFGYMNPTEKVAKEFPNAVFMHCSGYKQAANLGTYNARFYEGRYLAGFLAGHMSKSQQMGYVAGFPIPEVLQGINAFTLGARAANPKSQVRVNFVNTWFDPIKERDAALALVAQNADCLCYHTGSTAVPQAAEEKGIDLIAYHSDIRKVAPKSQLVAVTHQWGAFYTSVANAVLRGQWKSTDLWEGMAQGFIKLDGFSDRVPAAVRKSLADMERGLVQAKRHAFAGPVVDQSGVLRQHLGSVMSDADLRKMDYFVQGVIGHLPKR
jgi:basic membrane protein A and related proteins